MGKVKKEMNLEDIKELLEVYSEPPADKRTPYIVYRNLIEQGPESRVYVTFIILSKEIIEDVLHSPNPKQIHLDFSYGVSCDNLTLATFGTTNSSAEFLPAGIGLTTHETAETVCDVLGWIKSEMEGRFELSLLTAPRQSVLGLRTPILMPNESCASLTLECK
mgnify:CR=1 FL=1